MHSLKGRGDSSEFETDKVRASNVNIACLKGRGDSSEFETDSIVNTSSIISTVSRGVATRRSLKTALYMAVPSLFSLAVPSISSESTHP